MMDGEAPDVMPVKRRKRDAVALALGCDNQQTPNQQVDPTSAATKLIYEISVVTFLEINAGA